MGGQIPFLPSVSSADLSASGSTVSIIFSYKEGEKNTTGFLDTASAMT